jgi:hypothetical protein
VVVEVKGSWKVRRQELRTVDDATRALFAAVRALSPMGFEELVRLLPAQWDATLRMEGIDTSQAGFGVLLKARWQNFPRVVRRRFAQDMGAAAARVAAGPTPDTRIVNVATTARAAGAGRDLAGQGPKELGKQLQAAAKTASSAAQEAAAAVGQGRAAPDEAIETLREFGEAVAAGRAVLAERGVSPVPERATEIAELLEQVASGSDRDVLRAAVAALAEVGGELPVLTGAVAKARELLGVPVADWSSEQVSLAQGLAAVVELRRLAARGGTPEELLEVSGRAQSLLPADLQGLAILAASGGFSLPEPGTTGDVSPGRRGRRRGNAAVA